MSVSLGMNRGGLPAWTYSNPEMALLENEWAFHRRWQLVGHVSEIPNPGDFLTFDVAGERALVVRSDDGEVRAFHNLCRHRGSRVVADESGNCGSSIVCPFHGWNYALDGRLLGARLSHSFAGYDLSDHGLKTVAHDIWQGIIFVCFKPCDDVRPSELLRSMEEEVAPYQLNDLQPYSQPWSMDLDVNWKAAVDVDNEGYHVAIAHPALHDLFGRHYYDESLPNGVARSVGDFSKARPRLWSSKLYCKHHEAYELPKGMDKKWIYYGLFPNTVLTFGPEMVEYYRFTPLPNNRCRISGGYWAVPNDDRRVTLLRKLYLRINRQTADEDTQLIEWCAEGMLSSAYDDFILSDLESGVRAHHDQLRAIIPAFQLKTAPAYGQLSELNEQLRQQLL